MRKTTIFFNWKLLGLLLCGLFIASFAPLGGKKAAYRYHYQGGLQYSEGHYQRAVGLFRRAHNLVPDNYYFALSLAVGLSRTGQAEEGQAIIQRIEPLMDRRDPDYHRQRTLRYFFEGMIFLYNEQYGRAIPLLKRSISLETEPHALSIMHNALGYAVMLDQGKGTHPRADLPPHYHVHRRDLERAHHHFDQAVRFDQDNGAARQNFRQVSDSLRLSSAELDAYVESARKKKLLAPTFRDLPANIFRSLDFAGYDEVLFLLDISGSMVSEKVVCMGETRFKVMKETATFILDQLPPHIRLGIGTIGGDCGTDPRLWLPTGSLSRREFRQHLEFLAPDGTTPLLTILKEAPALFTDSTDSRRSIFLVSDGANICGNGGIDICAWAEEMARQGITINIMTFLDATFNHANAFAEYTCLADNTYGKIFYLDNYRCHLEFYDFSLLETCQLQIPPMQKVNCWGPKVDNLWAIFPE